MGMGGELAEERERAGRPVTSREAVPTSMCQLDLLDTRSLQRTAPMPAHAALPVVLHLSHAATPNRLAQEPR
jgi:hypothetical protein